MSRGRDRRAWNRQIGEQTVNVCIVLSVIPALLSGLLFWFARAAVGPDLPVWVTVLCWVPVALAIGGLVVAYLERHAWASWSDEDAANSLARASRLRTRQALCCPVPSWRSLGWRPVPGPGSSSRLGDFRARI